MGIKDWFRKKDQTSTPKPEENLNAKTLSPEERRAARANFEKEIVEQIRQLEARLRATTDPRAREKLNGIIEDRRRQLQ